MLYAGDPALLPEAEQKLLSAYSFGAQKPEMKKHVLARVDETGVTWL